MNFIRNDLANLQIINIHNICNVYNNINILMTQVFPKVYIYVRAFKYP